MAFVSSVFVGAYADKTRNGANNIATGAQN